ncbi:MAG: ATPase [Lysobacteraceae bacterium]|nr:MAG: ATPase [Xanthomonadaceae bacterium]
MTDHRDITSLVRANTPLLVFDTAEERRAVELFRKVVAEVWRPLFQWTIADGLTRLDMDLDNSDKTSEPGAALRVIRETNERGIYLLLDFQPFIEDPVNQRLMRDIIQRVKGGAHTVVMIGPEQTLPDHLERAATRLQMKLPDDAELERIVRDEAFKWSRHNDGRRVKVSRKALTMLVKNLRGLSSRDARKLARNAIYNDGAIMECDIPGAMQAKFELLNASGVLHYEYEPVGLDDIAGMDRLKAWLKLRQPIFDGAKPPPGLTPPRGILLLGVQGCGKSMAAKAVAAGFGVPLLRLDFGSIYNKYHGESERNLRQSLETASIMSPCILWMDEIEKGLAITSSDGGVSKRILGTLLTWMAEHKTSVFMVATANDVSALPPELLRKGRFDEIFFVDLPNLQERQAITAIHLRNRELNPDDFDLAAIAEGTDGWSGAEIEQAIVQALYAAYADSRPMRQQDLVAAIMASVPLSVTMREHVEQLRQWASGRTVPA